jgi:hypothetical protein
MLHLITKRDIEEAVDYLNNELSDEILEQAYEHLEGNQPNVILFHFGIGVRVRKILKEGNFNWNDAVYDDIWEKIIKKAAQKYVESYSTNNHKLN